MCVSRMGMSWDGIVGLVGLVGPWGVVLEDVRLMSLA